MNHRTLLIQRDDARGAIYADLEHYRSAGTRRAHHVVANLANDHRLIRRGIHQPARTRIDAQYVAAHVACTIGTIGRGEQT